MVEKCANPVCSTPFRRWGHGKLFVFENKLENKVENKTMAAWPHDRCDSRSATGSGKAGGALSFFWLCEACTLNTTLGLDATGRLAILELPKCTEGTVVDGATVNHARQFRRGER
jgi:hypothetical protein